MANEWFLTGPHATQSGGYEYRAWDDLHVVFTVPIIQGSDGKEEYERAVWLLHRGGERCSTQRFPN
jgi:hypothetical protein